MQKVTSRTPAQEASRFCEPRSSAQNNNFAQTKLNPFETFRFAESLSLPGLHTTCAHFPYRKASRFYKPRGNTHGQRPFSLKHGRLGRYRSRYSLFLRSPRAKICHRHIFYPLEQLTAAAVSHRKVGSRIARKSKGTG